MSRWATASIAGVAWLGLSRLSLEGAPVLAASAVWGVVFGALFRHWLAGVPMLVAACLADVVALFLGWFLYLGDGWFILPVIGGVAATVGGALWQLASGCPRSARRV